MSHALPCTTVIALLSVLLTGCANGPTAALERLVDARRLAGDLQLQFTRASDAANRAVMADTDEASVAFVRETEVAVQAIENDMATLGPVLSALQYSAEAGLLEEFGRRFAEYRTLDRDILGLAVENTNLKAQRMSFGSSQQAADAFKEALDALRRSAPPADRWRVDALSSAALASIREIQVLQAPHIAETDDAAMTRMEGQMAAAESATRRSLEAVDVALGSGNQQGAAPAVAAFDRFMSINAEIVALSRRNSNVRSLALSLGQKRVLTAKCDETLQAFSDALAKRGFVATR